MNAVARCEALAAACRAFPWLGVQDGGELLELIRQDLGSERALEEGIRRGEMLSRALPPALTLHIVSGNTPHAALQTLTRGLLLGGLHRVKVPSAGLPEVEHFLSLLPPELAETVSVSRERRADWLAEADCVVVFGSDETLAEVHGQMRPAQRFIAHGHKMGFGFVTGAWDRAVADLAAIDVCAFDQLGCLSPVAFFVEQDPVGFAGALATAMAEREIAMPRMEVPAATAAAIATSRNELTFRQRTGGDCRVWQSEGSTAWTVVYDGGEEFPRSPLHRFIVVKPMIEPIQFFKSRRQHLSSAGTNATDPAFRETLLQAGFQRVCPVGKMQEPGFLWHHDGYAPLGSRVRWVNVEGT